MDTTNKGVVAFLLIAFGLAWTLWEIPLQLGLSTGNPLFQLAVLPGALAPAIAAVIVRKWVTREGFEDAGLRLNLHRWRVYLFGWTFPLVAVSAIVLLAMALGIGEPDFSLERALEALTPEGSEAPSVPAGLLAVLPFQLMISALLVTPLLWGEEFGWRGYLQLRLLSHRPLLASVVTGIIWGLWHLPITLRGYNFPDQPLIGMLVFMVSAVLLSIIFGWLRVRTGSIWAPSLAHSATNAVGGSLTLLLFIGGPSWILVSYVGVLGWVPLGALAAWIVLAGELDHIRPVLRANRVTRR